MTNNSKGPISWMAKNPVTANLLMLLLLIGGIISGLQIKQEVFPDLTLDQVKITVAYPGASPEEVELGIILPIEEAIDGIDGIDKVVSSANEGMGTVTVEALNRYDINKLYQDIKNEIDRIDSFPEDAEEPTVWIPSIKRKVITMIIYGNQSDKVLRETAEDIRTQLLDDKDISQVELLAAKPLEISIEISREILRKYNLTLGQIANIIDKSAFDLPGGKIDTEKGEILIRVKERKDYGKEFENIPIITTKNGNTIKLGQIAKINDGFKDNDEILIFNNMPAIGIDVFRVGKQTPITVADAVYKHVQRLQHTLPAGLNITTEDDRSQIFRQRIQLLLKNGYLGLILVFILLSIFLEFRLAFWVTMGIPVSFLGSLLIIPGFDITINMVSLFAFIITLGIVVDDAIVVGENIYSYKQRGEKFKDAAIKGAKQIAVPVIFSVLTNMIAFLPMYFVPGFMGKIFRVIPVVVISVYAISLIESIFILPAHLGHLKDNPTNPILSFLHKYQQKVSNGFTKLIHNIYKPFLRFSLKYRYITIATGIFILMTTVSFVKSGRMGFSLFPKVESDFSYVTFKLPYGTPPEKTEKIASILEKKAENIIKKYPKDSLSKGILTHITGNSAWMMVLLTEPNVRPVGTIEFTNKWRKETGILPGVESIRFQADKGGPGSGASLSVELRHKNLKILEKASAELAKDLSYFPIVSDIDDGFMPGKVQFNIKLNELGYALGLTPRDVALQIRNSYYGAEALKQLRLRNEIKVMVRLDEKERKFEKFFDDFIIFTPNGGQVRLSDVATIIKDHAYTSIDRRDGKRVVMVTSNVTPQSKTGEIVQAIIKDSLPKLIKKYPGLTYSFEGKQADRRNSLKALGYGMIFALLGIFALLAIPFKSYLQPLIIMVSIPFGIVGAIAGHLIMGYSLSILSMFGIVALSGVVVNDSLVLIDATNQNVKKNMSSFNAIVEAATGRFRPILLTTMTTFLGLLPMIFEQSRQARFLIPMAISLGFGVLFSTLIILVLVPALYIVLEDIKSIFK